MTTILNGLQQIPIHWSNKLKGLIDSYLQRTTKEHAVQKDAIQNANIRSQQDWLRPLSKLMNREFKEFDTTVLTDDEIDNKLNMLVNELKSG